MVGYSTTEGKRIISYSKLEDLHTCPRKYQLLNVLNANPPANGEDNIDFMFGHAVGMGVQMLLMGLSLTEAILQGVVMYKADIETIIPRKKKSLWHVVNAIEIANSSLVPGILREYEVLSFFDEDGNARSGCELHFSIGLPDGETEYQGHMDFLAIHKESRKLKVFEIKTNAFSMIHEATYGNSAQVIGYSLAAKGIQQIYGEENNISYSSEVDVDYIVFKVPSQEFEVLSMRKGHRHWKKFWIDNQSNVAEMKRYEEEDNYPIRGSGCYDYFRPCFFFNKCHYPNHRFANYGERFSAAEDPIYIDFNTIESIIAEQEIDAVSESNEIVNADTSASGLTSFEI